jgi:hypothetical protein
MSYGFIKYIFILLFIFYQKVNCQIVINEIFPEPLTNDPEWIELYNYSTENFNDELIYLSDAVSTKTISLSSPIQSNSYFLITPDSSTLKKKYSDVLPINTLIIQAKIPSLNNTTDILVLRNKDSLVIDSVYYDMKWGSRDVSLERRDCLKLAVTNDNLIKSNAAIGATPGFENSVVMHIKSGSTLMASPNPFSPFGTGKNQYCEISYKLPFNQARIKAVIFNPNGEQLRKLSDNEVNFPEGTMNWDGKNDDGYNLSIGPYILYFEANDLNSDEKITEKLLLVIGN